MEHWNMEHYYESDKKAVEILKSGGIIAYLTDTIYGLGADIFNETAIKKYLI